MIKKKRKALFSQSSLHPLAVNLAAGLPPRPPPPHLWLSTPRGPRSPSSLHSPPDWRSCASADPQTVPRLRLLARTRPVLGYRSRRQSQVQWGWRTAGGPRSARSRPLRKPRSGWWACSLGVVLLLKVGIVSVVSAFSWNKIVGLVMNAFLENSFNSLMEILYPCRFNYCKCIFTIALKYVK